jgi:sulfide:quinone oxidoreductase
MQRRGIRTVLGSKLVSFEAHRVNTEGSSSFDADMIVFMPGLTGPDWAQHSGFDLSPGGFFQADDYCRVKWSERTYVVGDAGSYPGPDWLPKQAHMADLQARAAAENLLRALDDHIPMARPRPELVCIVDMLDAGVLVYRSDTRSIVFSSRWLHPLKRWFEWHYLRRLRRDRAQASLAPQQR